MTMINPSEEFMESVLKGFGTTRARVMEDVQIVKKWIQQQPHLPNVEDDAMLETMLLRCKCSVERAKQTWDLLFTVKTALPEIFDNRDPLDPSIIHLLTVGRQTPLPNPTSDGCRVFIVKLLKEDISSLKAETVLKLSFMMSDIALIEDRATGVVVIYDTENLTLDFITKWTLPVMKKVDAIMKGYKLRLRGAHFLNAPAGLDIVLGVAKAAMKSKLIARINVHANLESLHNHVDKKILPLEYGGEAGTLDQLSTDYRQKLEFYRDWFLEQDVVGKADESKRMSKSICPSDLFGFEGTFKKLTVD